MRNNNAIKLCSKGHPYDYMGGGFCPYCKVECNNKEIKRKDKWIVICAVLSVVMLFAGLAFLFFTEYVLLSGISIVGIYLGGASALLYKANKRLKDHNKLCIKELSTLSKFNLLNQDKVSSETMSPEESNNGRIVTIGRGDSNDVVVNDFLVNRHHCRIEWKENGQGYIVDLNSLNGTFVNGYRVDERFPIKRGDIIRIGDTIKTVEELLAGRYGVFDNVYMKGGMIFDKIELTDKYKLVIEDVERKVYKKLRFHPWYGRLGYCHAYWETKKRVLKHYGIKWRTPGELNPYNLFD